MEPAWGSFDFAVDVSDYNERSAQRSRRTHRPSKANKRAYSNGTGRGLILYGSLLRVRYAEPSEARSPATHRGSHGVSESAVRLIIEVALDARNPFLSFRLIQVGGSKRWIGSFSSAFLPSGGACRCGSCRASVCPRERCRAHAGRRGRTFFNEPPIWSFAPTGRDSTRMTLRWTSPSKALRFRVSGSTSSKKSQTMGAECLLILIPARKV
jgi:hypothetical protein